MNALMNPMIAMTVAAMACSSMSSGPDAMRAKVDAPATKGFAVVELFTSEGCSSCPPADKVLMELVDRAQRDGLPVYALSFHVDYWNRLGWKDPFSAAAWSERQQVYSTRTGDNVYTPQCVVNGTHSFVGSRTAELEQRVNDGVKSAATISVQGRAERRGAAVNVSYAITGDAAGKELMVALVENGLSSQVRAGENSGRHLAHTNVVRVLKRVVLGSTDGTGSLLLEAPDVTDMAQAHVILFVQEKDQGAIVGAAEAPIVVP